MIDDFYNKREIQNEQPYRNALDKFSNQKMKLPSKILEQIGFKTKPIFEEPILIVMDESTHEKHLSQPIQTNHKQFRTAVKYLTG